MNYLDAIILGLVQGLTEFLPVSSSGHLVLVEHLLGAKSSGVSFELLVHFGTLLAVLIYFRKEIIAMIKSLFDSTMVEQRKLGTVYHYRDHTGRHYCPGLRAYHRVGFRFAGTDVGDVAGDRCHALADRTGPQKGKEADLA